MALFTEISEYMYYYRRDVCACLYRAKFELMIRTLVKMMILCLKHPKSVDKKPKYELYTTCKHRTKQYLSGKER